MIESAKHYWPFVVGALLAAIILWFVRKVWLWLEQEEKSYMEKTRDETIDQLEREGKVTRPPTTPQEEIDDARGWVR